VNAELVALAGRAVGVEMPGMAEDAAEKRAYHATWRMACASPVYPDRIAFCRSCFRRLACRVSVSRAFVGVIAPGGLADEKSRSQSKRARRRRDVPIRRTLATRTSASSISLDSMSTGSAATRETDVKMG
jgi:hypothetical protein